MGYIIVDRNGLLLCHRIYKTRSGVLRAVAQLGGTGLYGNVFYKHLP